MQITWVSTHGTAPVRPLALPGEASAQDPLLQHTLTIQGKNHFHWPPACPTPEHSAWPGGYWATGAPVKGLTHWPWSRRALLGGPWEPEGPEGLTDPTPQQCTSNKRHKNQKGKVNMGKSFPNQKIQEEGLTNHVTQQRDLSQVVRHSRYSKVNSFSINT